MRSLILFLNCLGNTTSLARLLYRARTQRLWWDDFWAFTAMLSDIAMLVLFDTRYGPYVASGHDPHMSEIRQALGFFTMTSVLWGARMSVAITIVRLVPPGRGRCVAKGIAVLFALMWCGLLVHKLYICQSQFGLPGLISCLLPINSGYFELCTDLTADIWLICSAAYLLWHMKLTTRRQIVIFSVFASDVLLAAASIIHVVYILQQRRSAVWISAYVEVAISLIICNLLVLVTWLYSRIYPSDQDETLPTSVNNPTTTSASRRSRHPDAPIYGFDGSVLVLTQMSSPSISLTSSFLDNQSSDSTFGPPVSKPRTHSLDTLHPIITLPSGVLPTYLRPTKSCPSFFYTTSWAQTEDSSDRDITWNSAGFEAQSVKRPPSLAFSFDSESWNPTDAQTYGAKGTPHRSTPPHRKLTRAF